MLLAMPIVGSTDDEASNVPHVVASRHGKCYAKSLPAEDHGEKGLTKVFWVEKGDDKLVHTFDWYSRQIHLECNVSAPGKPTAISVVRFGPWARGQYANDKDLAVAFYWGGELVARYSTLDIAGWAGNVDASISHYMIFHEIEGFRWQGHNDFT